MTNSYKNYPPAIVIELGVNGLGTVRSLGRLGIPVIGIDSKLTNYGALSRYCTKIYCEDVNDTPLVDTLLDIGKNLNQKGVLFCASDLTLLVVSRFRDVLSEYFSFILPPDDVIRGFMSKKLFYDFAVKHQISVPKTFFTTTWKEVEEAGNLISTPCVIKPEIRDVYWCVNVPEEKVLFAKNREEFFRLFDKYKISNRPLIIQEWIDGSDTDVYFCLTYIDDQFNPMAVFTGKKIRQFPVLTGVTSLAVSSKEPYIRDESLKFLREAGCKGICGVEFKFCHKDKIFKLTEPTIGRTDLQEAISMNSGINIPYIAYLDALGKKQERTEQFSEGIKWINEPYDIYSASQYRKKYGLSLSDIISTYKGKKSYALLDLHDPVPFLSFLWRVLKMKLFRIWNKPQ